MNTLAKIVAAAPVPVVQLEEVPGSAEGVALFLLVLVERGSHDLGAMIVHEKGHLLLQQLPTAALGVWGAHQLGAPWPWLTGTGAAAAVYAVAWFTVGREPLEALADALQDAYRG